MALNSHGIDGLHVVASPDTGLDFDMAIVQVCQDHFLSQTNLHVLLSSTMKMKLDVLFKIYLGITFRYVSCG